MQEAPYHLLVQTTHRDNILTLTTACSTSCVFCSHKQNPSGLEVFYVRDLPLETVNTLIDFLDPSKKIIIGESATRICEGEPFLHSDILKILTSIRQKHPKTVIQITTSGVPLNEAMIQILKQLGGIELNISLNSFSMAGRQKLFNGKGHMEAVEAVALMKRCGIAFNGSIVAMPHIVGMEDIKETILFLSKHGAETVRVFFPGYTQLTLPPIPKDSDFEAIQHMVHALRNEIQTPILLEPVPLDNLMAIVEGILADSPAKNCGLKIGDVIKKVNKAPVYSRVDAYYKLLAASHPVVEILRDGQAYALHMQKEKEYPSGVVVNYDISPETAADIRKAIGRNKNKHILLLTSELAYGILSACIDASERVQIEKVNNVFFGGNIRCAGLLTIEDILLHLKTKSSISSSETLPLNDSSQYVILLPGIMFDRSGRDLKGIHYMTITEKLGIGVEIV